MDILIEGNAEEEPSVRGDLQPQRPKRGAAEELRAKRPQVGTTGRSSPRQEHREPVGLALAVPSALLATPARGGPRLQPCPPPPPTPAGTSGLVPGPPPARADVQSLKGPQGPGPGSPSQQSTAAEGPRAHAGSWSTSCASCALSALGCAPNPSPPTPTRDPPPKGVRSHAPGRAAPSQLPWGDSGTFCIVSQSTLGGLHPCRTANPPFGPVDLRRLEARRLLARAPRCRSARGAGCQALTGSPDLRLQGLPAHWALAHPGVPCHLTNPRAPACRTPSCTELAKTVPDDRPASPGGVQPLCSPGPPPSPPQRGGHQARRAQTSAPRSPTFQEHLAPQDGWAACDPCPRSTHGRPGHRTRAGP
nr:transcription initiation factor TFIID subunit 4-like [Vulpes vulpes]